jgi:hypothetical protein
MGQLNVVVFAHSEEFQVELSLAEMDPSSARIPEEWRRRPRCGGPGPRESDDEHRR